LAVGFKGKKVNVNNFRKNYEEHGEYEDKIRSGNYFVWNPQGTHDGLIRRMTQASKI